MYDFLLLGNNFMKKTVLFFLMAQSVNTFNASEESKQIEQEIEVVINDTNTLLKKMEDIISSPNSTFGAYARTNYQAELQTVALNSCCSKALYLAHDISNKTRWFGKETKLENLAEKIEGKYPFSSQKTISVLAEIKNLMTTQSSNSTVNDILIKTKDLLQLHLVFLQKIDELRVQSNKQFPLAKL